KRSLCRLRIVSSSPNMLEEAVASFNPSLAFSQKVMSSITESVPKEYVRELERQNSKLWHFVVNVHRICRLKERNPCYFDPLNLEALASPIGLILDKISRLIKRGKSSYSLLLRATNVKTGVVEHRSSKRLKMEKTAAGGCQGR
ncbi:hypothetical protein KI387_041230, partial [Taxus chinensis]